MERKRAKSGEIRLTEVAKLAGVSPITASRFFRNPESAVAEQTRTGGECGEGTGLRAEPGGARALASQRTEVIGVLIPSLTNNVFSDVLRGIYDASEGSRYSIQLANTRYSILQEEQLLRLFQAQKPAGLIRDRHRQTAESRAVLEAMNCPMVQIMEIGPDPVDMMIGFSHHDAELQQFPTSWRMVSAHRICRRANGPANAATVRRLPRCHEGRRSVRSAPDHDNPGAHLHHAGRNAVRRPACQSARYRRSLLRQ